MALAVPNDQPVRTGSPVTLRAVLIGLALVPLNVFWVIVAEVRWYIILTLNPLFITPIFYLFVLACLNAVIRKYAPRKVLRPPELVTIYVMLVLTCTVATHDFIINLMSTMAWPAWNASPSNGWATTMLPRLPRWLFVWDHDLIAGAFKGNSTYMRADILKMWAAPLAFWSLFIYSIGWTSLCLTVLIRRAWVEQTRLSFPIVRLPIVLIEDGGSGPTMRSKMLWFGFVAAALVNTINLFHEWHPSMPLLPTRAQPLIFPGPPWNTTWPLFTTFYPFAIGLAYLVPLDVSFSCWFFYLFAKAQSVIGYQLGYGDVPDFPYLSEQAIGAWLAFGIALLFGMRGYLAAMLRTAWHRDGRDEGEPMSYRVALVGSVVGMLVFGVFWWYAGLSPLWCVVVVGMYFLLALCITRVRAEAGGQHTVWDLEPMRVFRLFDARTLGPGNLTAGFMSHWYWRLNRSHPMPSQLEGFKLAQEHGLKMRSLVWPMLAAFALATFFGMWACIHVFYGQGAQAKCLGFASWTNIEAYDGLNSALSSGFKFEPGRWGAMGVAALFTLFLAAMRMRFAGFPFHPLGYCVGPALIWLWEPFMVAWLIKLLVLRYGGLKTYRRSVPLFLGLILGDYVAGAIFSLLGVVWNLPTVQTFH